MFLKNKDSKTLKTTDLSTDLSTGIINSYSQYRKTIPLKRRRRKDDTHYFCNLFTQKEDTYTGRRI